MDSFPYTYISCPCTDITTASQSASLSSLSLNPRHSSGSAHVNEDQEDERMFDPRSPRANYSLFPIEHLLYCEDCQQIRCPRCSIEEVVAWFCPGCYTESTAGRMRGEGGERWVRLLSYLPPHACLLEGFEEILICWLEDLGLVASCVVADHDRIPGALNPASTAPFASQP